MKLKYFTFENRERIEKRLLSETDISGLPTLGYSIDFGMGEIVLEECEDKFKVYLAVNYDKYDYQEFDNIEDAISALIKLYIEWDMIDKPNKMEKIIYQEIGLEHNVFNSDRCDVNAFFEKYNESKELTDEELKALYSLDCVLKEINPYFDVTFGAGQKFDDCIFKIDDDSWVVWSLSDGHFVYFPRNFDNIDEACKFMLERVCAGDDVIDTFHEYYESLLLTDNQLNDFAKEHGYVEPKAKTRSKWLYIK